jgi:hypothetical protein
MFGMLNVRRRRRRNSRQRMKSKSKPGTATTLTKWRAPVIHLVLAFMRPGDGCPVIARLYGKIVRARHKALQEHEYCHKESESFHGHKGKSCEGPRKKYLRK